MAFDIDRFVDLSKAVETSDLDWDYIKRVGITPDEARILRYMADVESHTIIYLRDILSGHTASDPEITQFLACWVYEETHHGRALDRFLASLASNLGMNDERASLGDSIRYLERSPKQDAREIAARAEAMANRVEEQLRA